MGIDLVLGPLLQLYCTYTGASVYKQCLNILRTLSRAPFLLPTWLPIDVLLGSSRQLSTILTAYPSFAEDCGRSGRVVSPYQLLSLLFAYAL